MSTHQKIDSYPSLMTPIDPHPPPPSKQAIFFNQNWNRKYFSLTGTFHTSNLLSKSQKYEFYTGLSTIKWILAFAGYALTTPTHPHPPKKWYS